VALLHRCKASPLCNALPSSPGRTCSSDACGTRRARDAAANELAATVQVAAASHREVLSEKAALEAALAARDADVVELAGKAESLASGVARLEETLTKHDQHAAQEIDWYRVRLEDAEAGGREAEEAVAMLKARVDESACREAELESELRVRSAELAAAEAQLAVERQDVEQLKWVPSKVAAGILGASRVAPKLSRELHAWD
jgi:chromosome segregation ATPase